MFNVNDPKVSNTIVKLPPFKIIVTLVFKPLLLKEILHRACQWPCNRLKYVPMIISIVCKLWNCICSIGWVVSHFVDSEGGSNIFGNRLHCVTFQKTVICMITLNLLCCADCVGSLYCTLLTTAWSASVFAHYKKWLVGYRASKTTWLWIS
jgi:hypothetical protein